MFWFGSILYTRGGVCVGVELDYTTYFLAGLFGRDVEGFCKFVSPDLLDFFLEPGDFIARFALLLNDFQRVRARARALFSRGEIVAVYRIFCIDIELVDYRGAFISND